jgi:hypothetical protein
MMKHWSISWTVALVGTAIIAYVMLFGYYTKTKTFRLTYFPNNSYEPTSNLPNVDRRGQPKVVLVRREGEIECFDVLYSRQLKELLEARPSQRVEITYRVRYRLHPFWIETLDVAGLGVDPSTSPDSVQGAYRKGTVAPGNCF